MFLTTLVRSSIVTDSINHTLHARVTEVDEVVLPGRVPGYKSSDILLLPSSTSVGALPTSSECAINASCELLHFYVQLLPHDCDETHERSLVDVPEEHHKEHHLT